MKQTKETMLISIRELEEAIQHIKKTRSNVKKSTTGLFIYDGFLRPKQ